MDEIGWREGRWEINTSLPCHAGAKWGGEDGVSE